MELLQIMIIGNTFFKEKDWDGFFKELVNDKPIYSVINKINADQKM